MAPPTVDGRKWVTPSTEELHYVSHVDKLRQEQLAQFVTRYINEPRVIFDLTGGIGGDTYYWASEFPDASVSSFEIVKQRADAIRKNTEKLENVIVFQSDGQKGAMEFIKHSDIDLIIIDAPWGEEYDKNAPSSEIFYNGVEVHNVNFLETNVMFKVPLNWKHIKDYKHVKRVFTRNSGYAYVLDVKRPKSVRKEFKTVALTHDYHTDVNGLWFRSADQNNFESILGWVDCNGTPRSVQYFPGVDVEKLKLTQMHEITRINSGL